VEGVVVDDLKHGQCRLAVMMLAKEGVVQLLMEVLQKDNLLA
jgi:peptide subunit release factor RF-3